jgi:hypothetical protein
MARASRLTLHNARERGGILKSQSPGLISRLISRLEQRLFRSADPGVRVLTTLLYAENSSSIEQYPLE